MSIAGYIKEREDRRKADAAKFAALDLQECQLCGAYGDDKRSFIARCFYDMQEAVGEFIDLSEVDGELKGQSFFLRICKDCRARMLSALGVWAVECRAKRGKPMSHDGQLENAREDANIPVRVNGAIRMLTREEWDSRTALKGEQHGTSDCLWLARRLIAIRCGDRNLEQRKSNRQPPERHRHQVRMGRYPALKIGLDKSITRVIHYHHAPGTHTSRSYGRRHISLPGGTSEGRGRRRQQAPHFAGRTHPPRPARAVEPLWDQRARPAVTTMMLDTRL